MALVGVKPHRAAPGKHLGRHIELFPAVELRVCRVHELVDFIGAEHRLDIVLRGHRSSSILGGLYAGWASALAIVVGAGLGYWANLAAALRCVHPLPADCR